MTTTADWRSLADNIEKTMQAGLRMREVVQRMADMQGITLEEADRRIEAMRLKLFPEGR